MKRAASRIISALLGAAMLLGSLPITAAEALPTAATAPEKEIDCISYRFDTAFNMSKYYAAIQGNSGKFEIVTDEADSPYVKLLYDTSFSPYSPYRISFKLMSGHKLTSEYNFARVTYRSGDALAGQLRFVNTASEETVTVVENSSVSKGEWVTAPPVNVAAHDILARIIKEGAVPLEYTGSWDNADFCIKEIVFFKSAEDACAFYGEEAPKTVIKTSLTFGSFGNGITYNGDTYGNNTVNEEAATVDISYAETTNRGKIHYMAKVKGKAAFLPSDAKYMRIEYFADHPDGVESAKVSLYNDAKVTESLTVLMEAMPETDGFELSPAVELKPVILDRFNAKGHCSLIIDTPTEGGTYRIKALHFFSDKESADAYANEVVITPEHTVKINGNDIKNYSIVIDEEFPKYAEKPLHLFIDRVKELTDFELPVITDREPEGKYEILFGQSSREKSYKYLQTVATDPEDYLTFAASLEGDTVSITAVTGYGMEGAVDLFLRSFLYVGIDEIPDVIEINKIENFAAKSSGYSRYTIFPLYDNIKEPTVFTEDFESDEGYFTEESGEDSWKYENGKYTAKADGKSLSYVHVWEADVNASAVMSYKDAGKFGKFGLLLRYTDNGAYAKAGYDFEKGVWFIDYREGLDHFITRAVSAKADIKPSTDYKLNFVLDGNDATLLVDGKVVLTAVINHVTPGQIGVFAEDVTAYADDYTALLLSGQGTVLKNTVHIKLPDEVYREGGTVVVLTDGTWVYQHHSAVSFISKDNGQTWQKTDSAYFPVFGYQQILRLNNGKLMQIGRANIDGVSHVVSFTSDDDGKTWVQGGALVETKHNVYKLNANNMNDKLTQSGTTDRIFYSINYEGDVTINGDALKVFCEYYYSDDNGATWHKAEDASYDLEGNKGVEKFGENKILQCADGTLRMYCSWNASGKILYSESADNGVTWGPLQSLDNFVSSHASMQFQRDPYGPTPTTYYMVWINAETPASETRIPNRSRLSLAYTEDGKNWVYLGDIWRWETGYRDQHDSTGINHIVDPFIVITEDYIITGTGIGERRGETSSHHEQRQNIWTIKKDTLPEAKKLTAFTDVTTGAPYYNSVMYAVDNGLFNGTSATTFEPDTAMTRSMFVTVLGRLDGADVAKYSNPTFSDVKAGQWYTGYVEWAAANSIVNGLGGGIYGINNAVTVEQALTILYRYSGGKTSDKTGGETTDFADFAPVSDWAADAVKWAVENGIYVGVGEALSPCAAAPRWLVATMFANYARAFAA